MGKTIFKNLIISIVLIFMFNISAFAKTTLSVSSSASSLNIGDKTTITVALNSDASMASGKISLKYDASKLEFVSCSETYGGGNGLVTLSTDKATVVLKAISAGSVNVSASAEDVWEDETEVGVLNGGSTAIEIKNAASEKPVEKPAEKPNDDKKEDDKNNDDNKEEEKQETVVLSADNSLKSLELSSGKLSPNFQYNKTKYTATVSNDVKSINVAAQVSNSKASIISLTGNDDLKVGENTISIVVKAENGVTAEYKIVVTRQDKEPEIVKPEEPEEEVEKPEETPAEEIEEEAEELMVKIYDNEYYIPTSMMNVEIPLSFYSSEIECDGETIIAYSSYRYDFDIIYMRESISDEYFWYILGSDVTPLIRIDGKDGKYIYVLEDKNIYDENYETEIIKINNFDVIVNKIKNDDSKNYIIYAVNENGEFSQYKYNLENGAYEKFDGKIDITLNEEENEEKEEIDKNKLFFIICGVIVGIGIIAIIVINVLANKIDDDDDEDDPDDDVKYNKNKKNEEKYEELRRNKTKTDKRYEEKIIEKVHQKSKEIEEFYDEDDYEERDREYNRSLIDDDIKDCDSIESLARTAKINMANAQRNIEIVKNPHKKK